MAARSGGFRGGVEWAGGWWRPDRRRWVRGRRRVEVEWMDWSRWRTVARSGGFGGGVEWASGRWRPDRRRWARGIRRVEAAVGVVRFGLAGAWMGGHSSGAKHTSECKMFSDFGLLLKQTQPKSCPIYNYYYHHCYISISLGKISEWRWVTMNNIHLCLLRLFKV